PFMIHCTTFPLSSRQRMSDLLSPLKSATSTMCQLGPGATDAPFTLTTPLPTIVEPFISHSASGPLALRHSTSDLWSPSKSPMPATLQVASGATTVPLEVANAPEVTLAAFMVHTATAPLLLRQRMSA